MYNECGEKYNLHYNLRIRPSKGRSAFVFGRAIDEALNELLLTNNEVKANEIFMKNMTHISVNGKKYNLEEDENAVVWTKSDVDPLLGKTARESLIAKGKLMIRDYKLKVLPRIKKVITVQEKTFIVNAEGDKIEGALDLIVEWEDGRILLMDNKTASRPYEPDSAGKSPQLTLYYWTEKAKYNLDAVGYITLSKRINHNQKKICKSCGYDGSGARHETCPNKIGTKRCDGEWAISYSPECEVDVIINDVDEKVVDETFALLDNANHGITNDIYEQNKNSCYGKYGRCIYFDLCSRDSMEGLEILEQKDVKLDKEVIS